MQENHKAGYLLRTDCRSNSSFLTASISSYIPIAVSWSSFALPIRTFRIASLQVVDNLHNLYSLHSIALGQIA